MLLFFCNARVFRWTFVDKLLFCIYRAQLVARKYFRSFLILRVFLRFYNRDGFIGGGRELNLENNLLNMPMMIRHHNEMTEHQ